MAKDKLRIEQLLQSPLDEDFAESLTDAEKEWLHSWNRQDEIPGDGGDSDEDTDDEPDSDDYDGWTNAQLQQELKRRDLPSSGNHAALVARLTEDDESSDEDDDDEE